MDCFERVLTEWNSRRCSPYTWDTIITVLQASAVGEVALANELAAKYGKHIFLCASVECHLDGHTPLGASPWQPSLCIRQTKPSQMAGVYRVSV